MTEHSAGEPRHPGDFQSRETEQIVRGDVDDGTDRVADRRQILRSELRLRALRYSVWISLLHAQELGLADLQGQLTSILVDVDQRRETLDRTSGAGVQETAPHGRRRILRHRASPIRVDKQLGLAT